LAHILVGTRRQLLTGLAFLTVRRSTEQRTASTRPQPGSGQAATSSVVHTGWSSSMVRYSRREEQVVRYFVLQSWRPPRVQPADWRPGTHRFTRTGTHRSVMRMVHSLVCTVLHSPHSSTSRSSHTRQPPARASRRTSRRAIRWSH
jgi:hypothetical protein